MTIQGNQTPPPKKGFEEINLCDYKNWPTNKYGFNLMLILKISDMLNLMLYCLMFCVLVFCDLFEKKNFK